MNGYAAHLHKVHIYLYLDCTSNVRKQ